MRKQKHVITRHRDMEIARKGKRKKETEKKEGIRKKAHTEACAVVGHSVHMPPLFLNRGGICPP